MKVAVLDLGSNTTKLLVAEVNDQAAPQIIAEESRACRLTSGTGERLRFSEQIIGKMSGVLGELLGIARIHQVDVLKAVATEAFRKSENSQELISFIRESFDLPITILSGREEAGYVASGLLTDPSISRIDDFHAIDIGGGSMEVIAVSDRKVTSLKSFPLGAAVISNRFCPDQSSSWTEATCSEAREYVTGILDSTDSPVLCTPCTSFVGSGGTLVFLRAILAHEAKMKTEEKKIIELSESLELFHRIAQMSVLKRQESYPSLPSSRADIFPAGLLVLTEVMSYFNRPEIVHSYHNLRYGVASALAKED
jgi:exopolyphosphatase/guanosine-5'-triphosphate,3'-diphosphate pyrophosphatase